MSTTYFDRVSGSYSQACESGLQGRFKAKEAQGVQATLLEHFPKNFEGKILDVGCGSGYHSRRLREIYPNLQFTGIDPSKGMIEEYRKLGLRGEHSSIESLTNGPIEFFDIVLVLGVLEFVKEVEAFIQSMKILCSNEAKLFVLVPQIGLPFLGYFFHHKLFNQIYPKTATWYIQSFEKSGFKKISDRRLTSMSELLVFEIEK